MGVYIPNPSEFVFSLPDKQIFSDYNYIWLIDYELNRVTNLLEQDYAVSLAAGTHNQRFALRIGGMPYKDNKGHRRYLVYTEQNDLHIRGLIKGDHVAVYSVSGHLMLQTTATSSGDFTTSLPLQHGYVVRINEDAQTVLNL